jgi:hypothetical protein
MAKAKKTSDTLSSRLALVMKSGKGESPVQRGNKSSVDHFFSSDDGIKVHAENSSLR